MSHHFLRFDNVSYTYPNGFQALSDISFTLTHGEKVAMLGANGAGKSSLMLHTNGLLMPTKGRVIVGDIPLTRDTVRTIRQNVGLVFQDPENMLFMPTVEEDVAFGPENMQLPPQEVERRIEEALRAVDALDLRHKSPFELSGGQKKRVAIATVLAMEPSILVMDEPTAALDPHSRRQIIRLIRQFDHTLLIATHDMELAAEICPRTLIIDKGRIVADDATQTIFKNTELLEDCALEAPRNFRF